MNGNGLTTAQVRTYEALDPREITQSVLPKGRVEAVLCVDPRLREETKRNWRIGFDRAAFENEDGRPVPLRVTVAKVSHCLSAMSVVVNEVRAIGLQPVAIQKEEDDTMTVGLWRHPRNPPVREVEVRSFTVRLEEIPAGTQPAFSEWMAVVEDVDAFKAE